MPDKFNPSHYIAKSGLEVIQVVEDFELDFHLGSAVSYILRAGRKAGEPFVDDLKKAIWMINRRLLTSEEPLPASREDNKAVEEDKLSRPKSLEELRRGIQHPPKACPHCNSLDTKPLTRGKTVCAQCYTEF